MRGAGHAGQVVPARGVRRAKEGTMNLGPDPVAGSILLAVLIIIGLVFFVLK